MEPIPLCSVQHRQLMAPLAAHAVLLLLAPLAAAAALVLPAPHVTPLVLVAVLVAARALLLLGLFSNDTPAASDTWWQ